MLYSEYSNPYYGQNFFGFFKQLGIRLWEFMMGNLSFSYLAADEIQVLVLIGVALSSALVGSFLVLRKMTMLANSLSHTILLGIVFVYIISHAGTSGLFHDSFSLDIPLMLITSVFMGVVTNFLTEFLTNTMRLQEDASIGIVFTALFALGIVLVTILTRNAHIGTEAVMGNVDSLQLKDCQLVFIIFALNFIILLLFFKEFKITTFDPALSRALGISTLFFNYLLMTQASMTVIGAFRAVGVLMVLAFITGPPLIARCLTNDLRKLINLAALLGCISSLLGVATARHLLTTYGLALSTGGVVVCMIVLMFLIVLLFKWLSGKSKWFIRVRRINDG